MISVGERCLRQAVKSVYAPLIGTDIMSGIAEYEDENEKFNLSNSYSLRLERLERETKIIPPISNALCPQSGGEVEAVKSSVGSKI